MFDHLFGSYGHFGYLRAGTFSHYGGLTNQLWFLLQVIAHHERIWSNRGLGQPHRMSLCDGTRSTVTLVQQA
jgi:hypothetical protein